MIQNARSLMFTDWHGYRLAIWLRSHRRAACTWSQIASQKIHMATVLCRCLPKSSSTAAAIADATLTRPAVHCYGSFVLIYKRPLIGALHRKPFYQMFSHENFGFLLWILKRPSKRILLNATRFCLCSVHFFPLQLSHMKLYINVHRKLHRVERLSVAHKICWRYCSLFGQKIGGHSMHVIFPRDFIWNIYQFLSLLPFNLGLSQSKLAVIVPTASCESEKLSSLCSTRNWKNSSLFDVPHTPIATEINLEVYWTISHNKNTKME